MSPYIYITFFLMLFHSTSPSLPEGFVYIHDIDPSIKVNLKYLNSDNFLGYPIPGYYLNKSIMTIQCAEALKKAQTIFKSKGYSILIYDSYRPQTAVNEFVSWITTSEDQRRKMQHYPRVDKKDLIQKGYVADKSGHSKGSTVDLTIFKIGANISTMSKYEVRNFNGIELPFLDDGTLDMGTSFDLMDEASHGVNNVVFEEHNVNRNLLKNVMESVGFMVLPEEWWHFTLKDEPFPDTYFDFPVE